MRQQASRTPNVASSRPLPPPTGSGSRFPLPSAGVGHRRVASAPPLRLESVEADGSRQDRPARRCDNHRDPTAVPPPCPDEGPPLAYSRRVHDNGNRHLPGWGELQGRNPPPPSHSVRFHLPSGQAKCRTRLSAASHCTVSALRRSIEID